MREKVAAIPEDRERARGIGNAEERGKNESIFTWGAEARQEGLYTSMQNVSTCATAVVWMTRVRGSMKNAKDVRDL